LENVLENDLVVVLKGVSRLNRDTRALELATGSTPLYLTLFEASLLKTVVSDQFDVCKL